MKLLLREIGTILGLRQTGKKHRIEIEQAISSGEVVTIDFEGVDSVSSSFVDELIAKLYVTYGKDKFTNCIKLINIKNDKIKDIISLTIRDRVNEGIPQNENDKQEAIN